MVRTWRTLLELLWPQSDSPHMTMTRVNPGFYKGLQYLFPYKDAAMQTLIKRTKYHADRAAARQLANYLDAYVTTLQSDYIIIPMPISYTRWRSRGYNHIELICRLGLCANKTRTDILTKSRHTKQQTQVTKAQRTQQQIGTFRCNAVRCKSLPPTVVLLDDVVTTGATMTAARATLQAHLPSNTRLICLAIAH